MAVRITDLVDENEIVKLKELDDELKKLLDTYTLVAKDLAKGIDISVNAVGDIERLERLLAEKGKEATAVQEQMNHVIQEQQKIIANTTNTISRQLMEQERLNKTQREAYTEHEKVKQLLDRFNDTYKGQTERLATINIKLKENKVQMAELDKAYSKGKISLDQYTARQAELIATQRQLAQDKRALTQLMTAEEKANQHGEDSYAGLSQQLEILKKTYKEFTAEMRASETGQEMERTIQNLDAHLKDLAADMGEFQRNVGNYAIATAGMKKEYDGLVATLAALQQSYDKLSEEEKQTENGKKLAQSIEQVSQAAKDAKKALDDNTRAVEEARASIEGTAQTNNSVKKDLKELVLEIANLTIEYQKLSEEEKKSAEGKALAQKISELTERAGVLRDAISDVNQSIKNAASDTRGLDQLAGTLGLAANGFAMVQGSATLLGISTGELAEIQTKLMAAIAVSNAATKIQNALQKQSAVMQAVNLAQTKLRTIAENLHTAAQGKGVVTTKLLTAAQWAFNAAANANPIGLLVVAITACIAAVYGLIKVFDIFSGNSQERRKALEEEAEGLDKLHERHEKEIEEAKARGASDEEIFSKKMDLLEKEYMATLHYSREVREEHGKNADEYKEALKKQKEALAEWEKIKEDAKNYLIKIAEEEAEAAKKEALGEHKYKQELINRQYEEQIALAQQLLDLHEINEQEYNDLLVKLKSAKERAEKNLVEEEKKHSSGRISRTHKTTDELKEEVEKGEEALLNLIINSHERQLVAEKQSYERRLRELQTSLSKTNAKNVKMRKALQSQIEGLTAEHNRKMADLEMSRLDRVDAVEKSILEIKLASLESETDMTQRNLEEEYNIRMSMLQYQQRAELRELDKMLADKEIAQEEYEEAYKNIVIKYANENTKLLQDQADRQVQIIQDRYSREMETADLAHIQAANALQMRYAGELALAKGNEAEQAKIKEHYEIEQAKLSEKYARQTAKASIDMLEEVLKNEQLSDEERLRYEQELARAKADLETAIANETIAQIERATDADNKAREKRIANAQQWLQVASDSLGAINDLVSAVYDGKISKIEEEMEANSTAGEQEIANIEDLVSKKVISEEEGEARKRAAEAKTAKKEEELAKKKQQLEYKQAVWDRANSIAQAGIATALAITQALPNIVLAAIAGAMGAVQIATILATPIPKYAKGTDNHPGGLALVGDGGVAEMVLFKNQSWITPDRPTLVDLPAGATVLPSIESAITNLPQLLEPHMHVDNTPKVIVNNDYKRLEEKLDALIFIGRRQNAMQRNAMVERDLNNYIASKL